MRMHHPLRLGVLSPSQVPCETGNFTKDATENGNKQEGILFDILEESLSYCTDTIWGLGFSATNNTQEKPCDSMLELGTRTQKRSSSLISLLVQEAPHVCTHTFPTFSSPESCRQERKILPHRISAALPNSSAYQEVLPLARTLPLRLGLHRIQTPHICQEASDPRGSFSLFEFSDSKTLLTPNVGNAPLVDFPRANGPSLPPESLGLLA